MIHKIHNISRFSDPVEKNGSLKAQDDITAQGKVSDAVEDDIVPDGVNVIEEIIAEDGYKLTQAHDVPIKDRIIANACMLGKGCSADEWKEISQEEADEIIAQQEAIELDNLKRISEDLNESK